MVKIVLDLREITEFLKDASGYIITFILIAIIIMFFINFVPVVGNSMDPAISDGQVVVTSKVANLFAKIDRFDIVVFSKGNNKYIKRVVGLPKEKISYKNNFLYVGTQGYKEENLKKDTVTADFEFEDICSIEKCSDGVIPEDYYLVLGDNRENSIDSRDSSIGLISRKEIIGKIYFRVWPLGAISKLG